MAYQDELDRTQQEAFQELYDITVGSRTTRYTSGAESVLFQGSEYLPRPIKRSNFSLSTNLNALRITITAPIDANLEKYIANAPPEPITIKITRVFMTSVQESAVIFEGEVIDVTFKDHVATVTVEARTAVFRNRVPKYVFQSFCNHQLFDETCGLPEDSYKVTATLSAVDESDLSSAAFGAFSSGYFTGGHVLYGEDYRLITNHVGNTITVQAPFDSSVRAGTVVYAFPGCDKDPATCLGKFGNLANFLGFPYIPSSNPTIWGLK